MCRSGGACQQRGSYTPASVSCSLCPSCAGARWTFCTEQSSICCSVGQAKLNLLYPLALCTCVVRLVVEADGSHLGFDCSMIGNIHTVTSLVKYIKHRHCLVALVFFVLFCLFGRQRTHSWAPALSPPVLFGPFSKTRSRSRSPRGRMSMVGPGLDSIPRLHGTDLGRLSTGGGDRAPALSKEASVSTAEEYMGWSEGEGGTAVGEEQHRNVSSFSDSALVMARLRLPNMELGFEEDGFFGIDVRSLIIGREIARGAYGVVHEGVLLEPKLAEEGGPDDGLPGAYVF